MVVTGSGSTVKAACKVAYGVVSEIKLSDAICRDDIGESLEHELPKLHRMGYCKDIEYE